MFKKKIPLSMFTDSKFLFGVIVKCSSTAEKRLLFDVSAVRNAYEDFEISDVGFVRSEFNPADGFTKVGKCSAFDEVIRTGKYKLPIDQWVIRK